MIDVVISFEMPVADYQWYGAMSQKNEFLQHTLVKTQDPQRLNRPCVHYEDI